MASKKKKGKKAGASPGTLVYTGDYRVTSIEVTLVQFNEEHLRQEMCKGKLPALKEGPFIHWYDIRGLHDVKLIESTGNKYDIHPLVLEDVLNIEQRPKFEEYENGLFIIAESLSFNKNTLDVETEQVSFFAGKDFLISFQEKETDLFVAVRERLETARGRIRKRGTDYLLYALLDAIVDHYFEVMDDIEDAIELLEAEILARPGNHCKAQIHALKLGTLYLRKHVSPLREAIGQFSRADSPFIQEETGLFLRDLYDHVIRVVDMIETNRDILNGLYDLYLSEISFKMNNVMQILTIISTIFIPLTFLAGIYGMNFDHMPELHWEYSYVVLWVLMIGITLMLLYYFRRKKWL